MDLMEKVRKRCYNWNSWSKDRAKKENGAGSTGRTTLKTLIGIELSTRISMNFSMEDDCQIEHRHQQ